MGDGADDDKLHPWYKLLEFSDAEGTPLPNERPAMVLGRQAGTFAFTGPGMMIAGNILDIMETMLGGPGPNLGPGLEKAWCILHPLLCRNKQWG